MTQQKELKRREPNYDHLFKIRPVLNDVLDKARDTYETSKNISIDEGMIAFKGRLAFRQYMPAKPTKYGIKVWMAADSSNGYWGRKVMRYELTVLDTIL